MKVEEGPRRDIAEPSRQDFTAPITLRLMPREIEVYGVSELELEQVSTSSNSFALYVSFLGIGVGAAVAFLIVLVTAVGLTPRAFALFSALLGLFVLVTIFSGIQAIRSFNARQRVNDRIKRAPKLTR